jgi:hypothetical protein
VTRLYFVFDLMCYDLDHDRISEEKARALATKLEAKIASLGS